MANGDLVNGKVVQRIIQGGAVGLALVIAGMYYLTVSNHIEHNTDALSELNGTILQGNEIQRQQTEVLRDIDVFLKTR